MQQYVVMLAVEVPFWPIHKIRIFQSAKVTPAKDFRWYFQKLREIYWQFICWRWAFLGTEIYFGIPLFILYSIHCIQYTLRYTWKVNVWQQWGIWFSDTCSLSVMGLALLNEIARPAFHEWPGALKVSLTSQLLKKYFWHQNCSESIINITIALKVKLTSQLLKKCQDSLDVYTA